MIKQSLPIASRIFLVIFVVSLLAFTYLAYWTLPDLLEKRSIQPPPPYKKLENIQGVNISSESGKVKYPHDYTIVLLGDSMTESLGNADELRGYLNEYYPDKTFEVLNYGYGATNIISGRQRLTESTFYLNRDFRPILDIDFDYLILESFGHNPLSEFGSSGIEKQIEVLDDIYTLVATSSGKEKLIFLSTIGTDKKSYAKNSKSELTPDQREQWALERDRYLENHLSQAKFYGVPYIDVYNPSLDSKGNVKNFLVREDDNIHPSPKGILFIQKKIADFLAANNFIK